MELLLLAEVDVLAAVESDGASADPILPIQSSAFHMIQRRNATG